MGSTLILYHATEMGSTLGLLADLATEIGSKLANLATGTGKHKSRPGNEIWFSDTVTSFSSASARIGMK